MASRVSAAMALPEAGPKRERTARPRGACSMLAQGERMPPEVGHTIR